MKRGRFKSTEWQKKGFEEELFNILPFFAPYHSIHIPP